MNEKIRSIKDAKDLRGKIVLLRLDLDVSIQNGKIESDFRLRRGIPTILYLRNEGAKVIIIGHIESEGVDSLINIFEYYKQHFSLNFITDPISSLKREQFEALNEGDVVLLENLRKNPGEKKNDPDFVSQLSSLADFYVNDAFAVSHRPHSSIIGIPTELPSYVGFVLQDEISNLSRAFKPKRPFLFILGGAKFDTKLPLIKKFLDIADSIYICGALANDCLASLGFPVGLSVVSHGTYDLQDIVKNKKILLPKDVLVKNGDTVSIKYPQDVSEEDMIVDIGEESILDLKKLINESSFILWNGPLGFYEKGFKKSTLEIATMIVESKAESIVGGGDTLTAIEELHLEKKFSFVSTGGGAMLEFLSSGTLPGIQTLEGSKL